jgi:hypothetical protein
MVVVAVWESMSLKSTPEESQSDATSA